LELQQLFEKVWPILSEKNITFWVRRTGYFTRHLETKNNITLWYTNINLSMKSVVELPPISSSLNHYLKTYTLGILPSRKFFH